MEANFMTIYVVVSLFFAFFNLHFAGRAFKKSGETGRFLGNSAVFAMIANLSYLDSIMTKQYALVSVFSSIYFIAIDWMLVMLTQFVLLITNAAAYRQFTGIRIGICLYAVFDTAVLLFNIFDEIAVHYIPRDTVIAGFTYQRLPLYNAHLIFTYFLVVLVLYVLISKILRTPRQYRNQYVFNVAAILLVVAMNAVFLFMDTGGMLSLVDISIFGYSLGLYFMYWSAFEYREKNMLESLSMMIFSNLDQGLVLFDYENLLIMHNKTAERMLEQVHFREGMPITDLLRAMDLPEDKLHDTFTAQRSMLRCDYSCMKDDSEAVIGRLFVFTDMTSDSDPQTGFVLWEKFREFALENPGAFEHPVTTVMFDIIGLDLVNRTFGREVGDQRIRGLARTVQERMPKITYFVRGYEAHLICVVNRATEAELWDVLEAIVAACGETVQYGMACTKSGLDDSGRSVLNAIESASHALQVKKLLDTRSARSQTLTSLVRALQESDSDTEAHVRRTQKMGDLLGRRIGLSDVEQSDLKLLCLLHDIGKVGIPLEILNKPGDLTDVEQEVLHSHAEKGYQIAMSSDELKPIARMIKYHHERWDGSGYPEGLSGTDIPLLSRIIAIVDAYDAMVNDRAYRKAHSPADAQAELLRCEGTQFDPFLVSEFVHMLKENPDIAEGEKTGGAGPRVMGEAHAQDVPVPGNTVQVPFCRYILDIDDYIIEVDQSFEEMTGYTRYDVLNRHMRQLDLIPQEEQTSYMIQVNNQFARGSIANLEHDIMCKDGRKKRIYCIGKRFFDSAVKAFRSEIIIFESLENMPFGPPLS